MTKHQILHTTSSPTRLPLASPASPRWPVTLCLASIPLASTACHIFPRMPFERTAEGKALLRTEQWRESRFVPSATSRYSGIQYCIVNDHIVYKVFVSNVSCTYWCARRMYKYVNVIELPLSIYVGLLTLSKHTHLYNSLQNTSSK